MTLSEAKADLLAAALNLEKSSRLFWLAAERWALLLYATDPAKARLVEEQTKLPADHPWAPKLRVVPGGPGPLTVDSLHRELLTELAKLGPRKDVDSWDVEGSDAS